MTVLSKRAVRLAAAAGLLALFLVSVPPARAGEDPVGDAVLDTIARHAVVVSFRFQRDLEQEERGAVAPDAQSSEERYRFWRMSRLVPGFVVKDAHTVLISDPWVSRTAIESILVRTGTGFETPATFVAALVGAEGALLHTDQPLPVPPVPVEAGAGAARFAGSLAEGPDGVEAWAADLHRLRRRRISQPSGHGFGRTEQSYGGLDGDDAGERTVDLVLDAVGRPLGFRFGSELDPDERWRGVKVLESRILTLDRLREMETEAKQLSPLHRLRITFRVRARHDRDRDPFRYSGRGTAEEEYWGLALTPNLLVIPAMLADDEVRRLVSIRLEDVDVGEPPAETDEESSPEAGEKNEGASRDNVKATYLGRLVDHRAFLVRVEGHELTCVPDETPPPPGLGEALLVQRVAYRGGERRDDVTYNRVQEWGRGYGDRLFLTTERKVTSGALLRDVDGRVLGFSAKLDPKDQEQRLSDGRSGSRTRSPFPVVAVLFHELGRPSSFVERIDDRVMPQEDTEAHLPWLGIEYDGVDEGLAELLEVSGPTRDGRRGLLVVAVHDDSPATKIDIRPGDILLSARRVSEPGGPPVDLRATRSGGMYFPGMFGGDDVPAPWRGRENTLVALLKQWGTGTTWELEWFRDGQIRANELVVESGPPHFKTAARHFDEDAGLEVRDLTYEVRKVLRIPGEAAGVVVARVEPGSAAAQARIFGNELLLELDGLPIPSAEAFGTMLEAAREAGRAQVRLVVRRLGKTRIVDLHLTASAVEEVEEDEEDAR